MSETITLASRNPLRTQTTQAIFDESNIVQLENTCAQAGCEHLTTALVTRNEIANYLLTGAYVQIAFPNLTASEREALFISGLCSHHYDLLMGGM